MALRQNKFANYTEIGSTKSWMSVILPKSEYKLILIVRKIIIKK